MSIEAFELCLPYAGRERGDNSITILRSDLRTLYGDTMVNDEVVNAFIFAVQMLINDTARSDSSLRTRRVVKRLALGAPPVHLWSSFFWEILMQRPMKGAPKVYSFNKAMRCEHIYCKACGAFRPSCALRERGLVAGGIRNWATTSSTAKPLLSQSTLPGTTGCASLRTSPSRTSRWLCTIR